MLVRRAVKTFVGMFVVVAGLMGCATATTPVSPVSPMSSTETVHPWSLWQMKQINGRLEWLKVQDTASMPACIEALTPLAPFEKKVNPLGWSASGLPSVWHGCLPTGYDPRDYAQR